MKKLISALLIFALMLSFAGCSLFSDNSIVKFEDIYTHKDPDKLTYDERIVLMGDGFEELLEDYANSMAYPDTLMYDEEGNVIGLYDYDAQTGLANGWTSTEDGTYTAFAEGEEVDLGMPDESLMVSVPGEVSLGFVVYGNKSETVCACMYTVRLKSCCRQMNITGCSARNNVLR